MKTVDESDARAVSEKDATAGVLGERMDADLPTRVMNRKKQINDLNHFVSMFAWWIRRTTIFSVFNHAVDREGTLTHFPPVIAREKKITVSFHYDGPTPTVLHPYLQMLSTHYCPSSISMSSRHRCNHNDDVLPYFRSTAEFAVASRSSLWTIAASRSLETEYLDKITIQCIILREKSFEDLFQTQSLSESIVAEHQRR